MEWLPTHQPGDQRDDPAADHPAPEDVAGRDTGSLHPQMRHRSYKLRTQGAGLHRQQREEECSQQHCWEERWPISGEFSNRDAARQASSATG